MFKFILGFFIGANLSLIVYSCLVMAKRADEKINDEGGKDE